MPVPAMQLAFGLPTLHELRRCAAGAIRVALVVVHCMAPDNIAVEVHRDHHVGARRAANRNWHGIDEATIHEPAI